MAATDVCRKFLAIALRGALVVAALLALLLVLPPQARAGRWDWSGSIGFDYVNLVGADNPQRIANAGMLIEWAQKVTVDVSDRLAVNAKVCTSCHGFAVDQAYAEIRLHRLANIEAGRINVPFGDYYLRHDPANDVHPSKPLPYAMGGMLRFRNDQFNLSVIPMPYSDQGASLFGDIWIHDATQIWYSIYLVNGFRAPTPRDFSFQAQTDNSGLGSDNNGSLSWGGRVSFARKAVSFGGSYLKGTYDPASRFEYAAWGVDLALEAAGITLRSEYLQRDTDVLAAEELGRLRKRGFYVQVEIPVERRVGIVGLFDGLLREGPSLGTEIDAQSGIVRWSLGLNISPAIQYTFRLAYDHWRFTDFEDTDVWHAGVVVAY